MDEAKLENRLTTLESAQQYMAEQIVKITETQDEIRGLALSVNSLAISVKNLCTDVTDVTGRVKLIESMPAKRWEQITGQIISIMIAAALGFFLKGAL